MADENSTPHSEAAHPAALEALSDKLNKLAAQLGGIKPIAYMLCDTGECGHDISNSINLIGATSDYINREICDVVFKLIKYPLQRLNALEPLPTPFAACS